MNGALVMVSDSFHSGAAEEPVAEQRSIHPATGRIFRCEPHNIEFTII
jgi:hypothetical protein